VYPSSTIPPGRPDLDGAVLAAKRAAYAGHGGCAVLVVTATSLMAAAVEFGGSDDG